jgi:Mce-associated membrane protein
MTKHSGGRIPWHRILRIVLGVALAAFIGTAAWLWWDDRASVDGGAVAVARQQAINFFSLDHRHIDDDLDRVLALSTGEFKDQYAKERDRIEKSATKRKVVITANVADDAVALEYQHGDRAQALVAIDAVAGGKNEPQTHRYRVRMNLRHVDGEWLVSDIKQVV